MSRNRLARVIGALMTLILFSIALQATPAVAADTTRVVSGHVYLGDSARSATAGEVTVRATFPSTYAPITTTTDADGNYQISITTSTPSVLVALTFTYSGTEPFSGGVWPSWPLGASSNNKYFVVSTDRPDTDFTLARPATITGQVLLGPNQTPATAGSVSVTWTAMSMTLGTYGRNPQSVVVDADGRYSITVPGGYYELIFRGVGATSAYRGSPLYTRVFGDDVAAPSQTLYEENSLNGRIRLGTTGPFAGAGDVKVTPLFRPATTGAWTPLADLAVLTDAGGHFTISGAPEGNYRLSLEWLGSPASAYRTTESPPGNGDRLWTGHWLDSLDRSIARSGSISGQVLLDEVPAGAGAVRVSLGVRDNGVIRPVVGAPSVTTTGSGMFLLTGLDERSYVLLFEHESDQRYLSAYSDEINIVGTDASGIVQVLTAREALGGRVTDSAGAPLEGATITLRSFDLARNMVSNTQATTNANGQYLFRALDSDHYYQVFFEAAGFANQSWPSRGPSAPPGEVRLAPDQIRTNIDATLDRTGQVSGVVSSSGVAIDALAPDAYVSAISYDPHWRQWVSGGVASVGADGTYTLTGLAPDTYKFVVTYAGIHGQATLMSTPTVLTEGASLAFSASIRPVLRDLTGDGFPDILTRTSAGALVVFPIGNQGTLLPSRTIGTGWRTMAAVVSVGDMDRDGFGDVVGRDARGTVRLYRGDGSGGWLGTVAISSGWVSQNLIVGPGDANGDGYPDLISRDSRGDLWLWPGTSSGTSLGTRIKIGTGWSGLTAILAPGDLNSDGAPDLVGRDRAGALWLYPGNGTGGLLPRIKIGTGWASFTAIFGIGDVDGDSLPDLLARDRWGYLWLYPGTVTGGFRTPFPIGTNWKSLLFAS